MAYYSKIVESVKLGRNETIIKDIYYILDVSGISINPPSNSSDVSFKHGSKQTSTREYPQR